MKVVYIYLRVAIALILSFVLLFGVVPDAFNMYPILGMVVLVLVPLLDFWLLKPIFKNKPVKDVKPDTKEDLNK